MTEEESNIRNQETNQVANDSKGIEIFCDNIKDTLLNADLESEIEEDFIEDPN